MESRKVLEADALSKTKYPVPIKANKLDYKNPAIVAKAITEMGIAFTKKPNIIVNRLLAFTTF